MSSCTIPYNFPIRVYYHNIGSEAQHPDSFSAVECVVAGLCPPVGRYPRHNRFYSTTIALRHDMIDLLMLL